MAPQRKRSRRWDQQSTILQNISMVRKEERNLVVIVIDNRSMDVRKRTWAQSKALKYSLYLSLFFPFGHNSKNKKKKSEELLIITGIRQLKFTLNQNYIIVPSWFDNRGAIIILISLLY